MNLLHAAVVALATILPCGGVTQLVVDIVPNARLTAWATVAARTNRSNPDPLGQLIGGDHAAVGAGVPFRTGARLVEDADGLV